MIPDSKIFMSRFLIDSRREKESVSSSSKFGTLCWKNIVYSRTFQSPLHFNVHYESLRWVITYSSVQVWGTFSLEILGHKKYCSGPPSLGTNKTWVGHWTMNSIVKVERKGNIKQREEYHESQQEWKQNFKICFIISPCLDQRIHIGKHSLLNLGHWHETRLQSLIDRLRDLGFIT